MFAGAVGFLKSLPAIISLIREILAVIKEIEAELTKAQKAKELKLAVQDARQKGDTSRLEAFFNSKSSASADSSRV